jgi:hypothetical protein
MGNRTLTEIVTPTIAALARRAVGTCYGTPCNPAVLPILADALDEAGYANADLLHEMRHFVAGTTPTCRRTWSLCYALIAAQESA